MFGEWRDGWSATATISLEISSLLASNSSLFLRCEMSRARCTIRRRSRRGSSNTRVETFTHSLLPERVLTSRSKSGVSNFCAAHCWTLQSPIQTCVLRRDRLELHSTPAEEYPNSRSAAWFHGLPQMRRPPSSAGMRTVPPPASRPSRLSIEGFNSIMRPALELSASAPG